MLTWLPDALARYDINAVIHEVTARLDFLERHCQHPVMVNDDTGQNRLRCLTCGAAKDQVRP